MIKAATLDFALALLFEDSASAECEKAVIKAASLDFALALFFEDSASADCELAQCTAISHSALALFIRLT